MAVIENELIALMRADLRRRLAFIVFTLRHWLSGGTDRVAVFPITTTCHRLIHGMRSAAARADRRPSRQLLAESRQLCRDAKTLIVTRTGDLGSATG